MTTTAAKVLVDVLAAPSAAKLVARGRASSPAPRRRVMRVVQRIVALLLAFAAAPCAAQSSGGEDLRILRMGTGGTGGTYFPVGSLIAQAISEQRDDDGRLRDDGVRGLLAVAQISNGSIANVNGMRRGHLDVALVQSDVVYWSYHGMAVFGGQPRQDDLRVVAHLYPESLHLVARTGSGITPVADLRGRRVSLDEPGSGTMLDARFILEFYGLKESDLNSVYLKPHFSVMAMEKGELDAFFVFAGYPVAAINRLAGSSGAMLVPLSGPAVERIVKAHPYFSRGVIPNGTYGRGVIPAGTYKGVGDTPTLEVGAQLVVRAGVDERAGLPDDPRAVERGHARAVSSRATPRAARCGWTTRWTGSAFRCIRALPATTASGA